MSTRLDDTISLAEVIIKTKTRVKIAGDTISYTVDSFYRSPLANIEDVLRKLPGIDVAADGRVSMQGRNIDKISINGKEYYAQDIRTITQNLPAEALEKIQVADLYDDETIFSGIRRGSQQKAINLKLKKQYEKGLYSRIVAGYGTKQRYQSGLFANVMTHDLRVTAIGNVNNTGATDVTTEDNSFKIFNLPGQTRKEQANINFSYDNGGKIKLMGSYEITTEHTDQVQLTSKTTYLQNDSVLLLRQSFDQQGRFASHRFNVRATDKINERLNMITELSVAVNNRFTQSRAKDTTAYDVISNPAFSRASEGDKQQSLSEVRISNMFQRKFNKKGRGLSATISGKYMLDKGNGTTENANSYFLPPFSDYTNLQVAVRKYSIDAALNVQYSEPVAKAGTLSAKYTYGYITGHTNQRIYNGTASPDTAQDYYTRSATLGNSLGIVYQHTGKKLTIGGGMDAQKYNREIAGQLYLNSRQAGLNYFPNAFAKYSFSRQTSLDVNYTCSVVSPDVRQLQQMPDYTDSLNIYIGNPALKPELDNDVILNFSHFNIARQKMIWGSLRTVWVGNKIINKTNVSASRRILTPVNADGSYDIGYSVNYTTPFIPGKLKMTIGSQGSLSDNVTVINDRVQTVRNYNYQALIRLSLNLDWYEGELGYNYNYNCMLPVMPLNSALGTHSLSNNATIYLPANLRLSYYITYVYNKGLTENEKSFLLLNVALDKTFTKLKNLSFRVQGFDLLNKYPNITRNYGDNYFEDRSVSRVGSYFCLSAIYRMSHLF